MHICEEYFFDSKMISVAADWHFLQKLQNFRGPMYNEFEDFL